MSSSGTESTGEGPLADRIDALLPQTQCARCGYPSCRDYSNALAAGEVETNRCPPGGASTIEALAGLLGRDPLPLDPACGGARPWVVARIDEGACIGCTLCIQACPVDAILGAAQRMHTVIEDECTGCELCLDACPVDCIVLDPMRLTRVEPAAGTESVPEAADDFLERWMRERAPSARRRFENRRQRLRRLRERRAQRRIERAAMPGRDADRATKQATIRAAVERALQRRRGARRVRS
jgi:electron transport complex protein RnfB